MKEMDQIISQIGEANNSCSSSPNFSLIELSKGYSMPQSRNPQVAPVSCTNLFFDFDQPWILENDVVMRLGMSRIEKRNN